MTTVEEKGEELKAIQPVDSNPTTVGASSKTFEELSEEYDDWDENIHTYASDRVGHRIRTNSAGAEQIARSLSGDTNPSIFTPRQKRKARSQSFSERSLRKHSLHGTAKEHAMLSKQNSIGSETNTITSNPLTSTSKHDPEFYKAVNEYYSRLANGFHNEKNYDSLFGTPDYIVKRTTLATNNNKASSNSDPHLTTRQFNRSIYWLVHNRRKYGFRHLCMLILVLVYTLLGAAMFFTIEAKHEHHTVTERKAALDKSVLIIAGQLMSLQNGTDIFANMSSAEEFVKSTYISLLKDESLYEGSTYWKASDAENFKWTYASAFFFSMNLYTTTGYGSIAAESMLGRICVIWYSMLTIPITLVVIRDLGQATLVCITKVYAHILVKFRRTMGYLEPHEDSMISLPIKFCLMLLAGYLLFTAAFIYLFDDWMGYIPHTGLSFFTSLYFSYISISTIGLGDIMPNNATFHPIISILFFFGMPVMKVVNRATYICIENGVFGAFTLLENSIDRMTSKIKPREEPQPSRRPSRKISRCSYCSHINDGEEEDKATELLNGLTIRSLAAFARTNADVYGGGFGRVNLRKGDLVQSKTSVGQNPDPSP
nr:Ion transport 2 domain containing protein [Haemonchus contortus]